MVIGGISYFKTSGPLRHRHATLTGDDTESIVNDNNEALLRRIEAIIVSALKK